MQMTSQNNRLALAVGSAVVIAAILAVVLVFGRVTALPYAETTPERAKQARVRIEAGRKLGPPGLGARR